MLLYNVCYLAYTQAVEIPLSQAGDVLSNLWSVCCSTELGRSVHIPLCTSEWLIIDAADLTKHTRYFRRPRRPVSHSTLRSYSRPLLRLPRHVHARRVHELREQTSIGVRYRKRTSGTCWTMTKQVLLNSPSTAIISRPTAITHFFLQHRYPFVAIPAHACITLSFPRIHPGIYLSRALLLDLDILLSGCGGVDTGIQAASTMRVNELGWIRGTRNG